MAAHCVWLSDTEIGLMRETGTHISHNPMSNAKRGVGVARLLDYRAAGINVGLGHDSTEGVNSSDLFEVMSFASLVQRAVRMDADLLHAADLLRMATRNWATTALGHDTGIVAAARKADLIVVDVHDPVSHAPCTATGTSSIHTSPSRHPATRCEQSSSTGTW